MKDWAEIISEARDRNKEKTERQRRLKIAKVNLKGPAALKKAQGKRNRLSPEELKLRERDVKVRERRQDTRETEGKRKKEHSAWVIGQSQKNAEERKRKQLEDIKNKPRQAASAALSDIKTQTISQRDSDATAYTKVVGNVASLAGGLAKAGIRYGIAKHQAKKAAAAELEKKDGGGSGDSGRGKPSSGGRSKTGPVRPSIGTVTGPASNPKRPKKTGHVRPSIGTVTGPASNPKRPYNEGYSNWKEDFIFEVEDKNGKTEKKKIVDVMRGTNSKIIKINPDISEDHKEIASGKRKDDEGYMANVELDQMERAIKSLRKKIKRTDTQMPAWVQSKITKAADYIDTASDYLQSDEELDETYDDETFRQHSRSELNLPGSSSSSATKSFLKRMKELNMTSDGTKPKKKKKKKVVSEESEDKRYCKLCRREEKKTECSYCPKMWEKYTISEMAPAIAALGRIALSAGARQGAKSAISSEVKDIAKEKLKNVIQDKLASASERLTNPRENVGGGNDENIESSDSDASAYTKALSNILKIKESVNKDAMKCNKPKAQAHGSGETGKSHIVKACEGGNEKIIRFGQLGVKGSPKKEGESKEYASRRNRFKTRHAKNIAKGKMSAAWWSSKVKW